MSTSVEWPVKGRLGALSSMPRKSGFYLWVRKQERPVAPAGEKHGTPAFVEIRRAMVNLSTEVLGDSGLNRQVQQNVLEFLRAVTTQATTYPSVVPDDDGVAVLHWVAGGRSVQVDIEESGPTYLWAIEPNHSAVVHTDRDAIVLCARIKLERIANEVAAVNPLWRERMRRS